MLRKRPAALGGEDAHPALCDRAPVGPNPPVSPRRQQNPPEAAMGQAGHAAPPPHSPPCSPSTHACPVPLSPQRPFRAGSQVSPQQGRGQRTPRNAHSKGAGASGVCSRLGSPCPARPSGGSPPLRTQCGPIAGTLGLFSGRCELDSKQGFLGAYSPLRWMINGSCVPRDPEWPPPS